MSKLIRSRSGAYRLLLLILAGFIPSIHGENTESKCNWSERTFPSIEATVIRLSQCHFKTSLRKDREYIAAILEERGLFLAIVQSGTSGMDKVHLRFPRGKNQTFVAMWHTHGANGLGRDSFSKTDTELVNRLKIPFYLTDPIGFIRRFDPGAKLNHSSIRLAKSALRTPVGSAPGIIIGHI